MIRATIFIAAYALLQAAFGIDVVVVETNCVNTATGTNCPYSDAVCTPTGECVGPASCTADCSAGPICGASETCWPIYNSATVAKCCVWIGASGGTNSTTEGTTTCYDLAASGRPSDCPANANLCQDTLYKTLMQTQCPKTCGYCTTETGTGIGNNTNCVDKAASGRISDCPSRSHLCNDALYYSLMTDQCPKTCGRCGLTNTIAVTG